MHHALEIQEILLNIFQRCYLPGRWRDTTSDLTSLARTCHAFREPALDVLWGDLDNLLPLAQCLPEASRQLSKDKVGRFQVFVTLCLMVNIFHPPPSFHDVVFILEAAYAD